MGAKKSGVPHESLEIGLWDVDTDARDVGNSVGTGGVPIKELGLVPLTQGTSLHTRDGSSHLC